MNLHDIDTTKLPSKITLTADDTKVVIASDGFYYNDEKIEDVQDVYNRFNEWLKVAIEEAKNKEED